MLKRISVAINGLKIKSFIFYIVIAFLSLLLYTYKLDRIPTNITGDESTYISFVYKILYSKNHVNPLFIAEDTKPAVDFYWMALWVKTVGLENSIFGMRLSIVVLSVLTLSIFFKLLKNYISLSISFITTILLATSVWYINFSRSSWINIGSLFFGITMIYFLEKALKENIIKLYIVAGIFGGLCFYGYTSGYVYPISAFIYLIMRFIFQKKSFPILKNYLIFLSFIFIIFLPLFISIRNSKEVFLLRPTTVFVFNKNFQQNNNENLGYYLKTLKIQFTDVVKGLILIDGSVIGKNAENLRYFPNKTPVLDPIAKLFFLSGLILCFFIWKKIAIWIIVYVVTIATVGALTVDTPNLARTIPVLLFMYLLIGIALEKIITLVKGKISKPFFIGFFALIVLIVSIINIKQYFFWIEDPKTASARQPALNYSEFSAWQNYQIKRVKNNKPVITNYDWYIIRERKNYSEDN